MASWQICIDTGGTFTDCWGLPSGSPEPVLVKLLSSGRIRARVTERLSTREWILEIPANWSTPDGFFVGFQAEVSGTTAHVDSWEQAPGRLRLDGDLPHSEVIDLFTGEEAPVVGARLLTGTAPGSTFPELDLRLATTRGTNALLEGKGAPPVFLVTKGFGDLLEIRDQRRPDLFALNHQKPRPVYQSVVEVEERLDRDGQELEPLNPGDEESLKAMVAQGHRTAAVALLHSYLNPRHELALGDHLLKLGFEHVSLSSELAPQIKIVPRAETAVIDAYLTPVMTEFLDHVQSSVGEANPMLTMTSAGGLESRASYHPKDSLFSGPAGGVVGAAAIGRASGCDRLITFDMGGTSTDVARYDGDYQYQFQQRIGSAQLLAPSLRIETVASGGGSICQWTEAGLRVGPESAGADPGPACYGRGGPLAITDVNLLLGRIDPDNFGIPIGPENLEAARSRLRELMDAMGASASSETEVLEGLLAIAVEQMADSIRTISVREGADPSEYALLAFGGGGPLHACEIAEKLGMDRILVPAEAGVLSAYGLYQAVVERFAERQILQDWAACQDQVMGWLEELRQDAMRDVAGFEGVAPRRRLAELRLMGQDSSLTLEIGNPQELAETFRQQYKAVFGYQIRPEQRLELVSLRVVVSTPEPEVPSEAFSGSSTCQDVRGFQDRETLKQGSRLRGPVVIQDRFSTFYLKEGWETVVGDRGTLRAEKTRARATDSGPDLSQSSPVIRELFRHRFAHIVQEMGAMLQRSAISTNVKERADFSCALLDRRGELVVNAPHIPVHLGALGLCVREVVKVLPLNPGDMAVTNHPGFGGSHLPDVTVISPVFVGEELLGYVANRAHHAEIGGIRPGSMPPDAANLEEEGVVITPRYLFESGESKLDGLVNLLTSAPYPTRNPEDNRADLMAQAAANLRGVEALQTLAATYGHDVIQHHLGQLTEQAHQSFEDALANKPLAADYAVEQLDGGARICVAARKSEGRLILDFEGTSPRQASNLNATPAIVRSALLYCLRLWTDSELPLNEGLIRDLEVRLPECFLNPDFPEDPRACPAVVGGNVETSQRLVDTVLKLFGIQACSQGTMNNFIFGNPRFGYYETIAGGAGAGPGYDGASALHTHMTNTAITDPEIIEKRYPVRLRRFAIREGSGGAGQYRGGDGVIREFEFVEPLEVSLLTQHRVIAPYGLEGGVEGKTGQQVLVGAEGERELESQAAVSVQAGDRIVIETPGGGGWGKVESE